MAANITPPMTVSGTFGRSQSIIAPHDASSGSGMRSNMLTRSAMPEHDLAATV